MLTVLISSHQSGYSSVGAASPNSAKAISVICGVE